MSRTVAWRGCPLHNRIIWQTPQMCGLYARTIFCHYIVNLVFKANCHFWNWNLYKIYNPVYYNFWTFPDPRRRATFGLFVINKIKVRTWFFIYLIIDEITFILFKISRNLGKVTFHFPTILTQFFRNYCIFCTLQLMLSLTPRQSKPPAAARRRGGAAEVDSLNNKNNVKPKT